MDKEKLSAWSTRAEYIAESIIFSGRWLLAPFYVGLVLSIVVLLIKFIEELFHLALHAFHSTESEVILGVLSLVDMALTGSLLIIVIFSGYENFVSRFDHSDHKDWPAWMGTIDFSALKLKLLSSIVAISAIQLLKQFMALNKVEKEDLMWMVIVHVVFVVSSLLLALSDRLSGHDTTGHGGGGHDGSHSPRSHEPNGSPNQPGQKGETMIAVATVEQPAGPAATTSPAPRDSRKAQK